MNGEKNPLCSFCKSDKVIKHGKTSTGNPRYRCRVCGKTWVLEKNEPERPDLSDITEDYLNGKTFRDLVDIYHSSPLRINQKIREFLAGCPNWEVYLDTCVQGHEPRIIYLIGRNFSCAAPGSKNNKMFLAMAVDALSIVVLGYEVGKTETRQVWLNLLGRLRDRGISSQSFMTNGSKIIDESVKFVYPESSLRINYHRAYRDREITCCIHRIPINNRLITDALKIYNSLDTRRLDHYLKGRNDKKVQEILFASPDDFIARVKERLEHKAKIRIEGLTGSFQTRFEKFHMLKDDPLPVINGWIARSMVSPLHIGFSRLSIYMQVPCNTSFKLFSCGTVPKELQLDENSPLLKTYIIEVAARSLQLPILYHACEMKLDKCSLF